MWDKARGWDPRFFFFVEIRLLMLVPWCTIRPHLFHRMCILYFEVQFYFMLLLFRIFWFESICSMYKLCQDSMKTCPLWCRKSWIMSMI